MCGQHCLTKVGEAGISSIGVAIASIAKASSVGKASSVREDRSVVDERSGGGDDAGGASKDGSVSISITSLPPSLGGLDSSKVLGSCGSNPRGQRRGNEGPRVECGSNK